MQGRLERIWEGRLHLGDEPGVYGDAAYVGLAVELPITLGRFRETVAGGEAVEIIVEAQDVNIFEGYHGHRLTVRGFVSDPAREPEWQARELAAARMTSNAAMVRLEGDIPTAVSLRIEVDSDAGPGLFDDFVLRRVSIRSKSHFASLGFRAD